MNNKALKIFSVVLLVLNLLAFIYFVVEIILVATGSKVVSAVFTIVLILVVLIDVLVSIASFVFCKNRG